ncbi:hypothetical protein [Klebsiella aerogenes]|uniref:hypothetical protein n=1 Tax=Klebsiella aerogenes TaxID=548 RepID=UPI001BCCC263|nr:hypothetical protein [Klebsiella aerogenes]HCR0139484.1 hypothetical protein [Klebsiella aerogenes]HED4103636.1 hypothetical protein [Klebsiella aerogenes]
MKNVGIEITGGKGNVFGKTDIQIEGDGENKAIILTNTESNEFHDVKINISSATISIEKAQEFLSKINDNTVHPEKQKAFKECINEDLNHLKKIEGKDSFMKGIDKLMGTIKLWGMIKSDLLPDLSKLSEYITNIIENI